ncbi:MAG: DUF4185 domain-containing protein [Calditrichaeota bacterium]|nr:DUF4185 domain-containing protein [Calditrichota bacterium]
MRKVAAHTAEPKELKVARARDCGLLFADNAVRMIGQDCAYSIPLPRGEALWVFGDTLLGTFDECGRRLVERMPSSTGLLSASGLRSYRYLTGDDGYPRQLLPWLPEEDPERYRIWPLHGIFLHGRVYLYFVRVELLPGRCWPYKFDVAGTGLAVADYPELAFERLVRQDSTIWWAAHEPCYGAAVLPVFEEGIVYVYGTWLREGHHYCSITRVKAEQLDQPEAYEYLVSFAPEWSRKRQRAVPIMDGMPTEMSVSYNAYLGCYLAVHSWETTGKLVARTAPCPWGPWSQPQLLWTARVPLRNPLVYGGPLVYAGKEHPELAREQGRVIYLTFVEFEEYYPRLIEVTLE